MTYLVIDASVAVKWCLPPAGEELIPQAEEILNRYQKNEIGFLVPDLFWVEVANAVWKAVRGKRIPPEYAARALTAIQELHIPTVPSSDLLPEALLIAIRHNRTVYDSLYVALAVRRNTEMITADERLANALAAYLPVKWLGAR